MPDLGLFIVTSALLAIAPGPDIVYVLTRGIAQGRKAGIAAALGFATGCIFHTALAAFGVAALIRSSDLAFDLVRYAGAAYLAWIGIQALRHASSFAVDATGPSKTLSLIYRQSVIGNALNPKVTLFFLSFLPQFVNTAAGHVAWQMVLLGAVFMAVTFVVFVIYGVFAAAVRTKVFTRPRVVAWVRRSFGATYLVLAGRLAAQTR